MSDEKTIIRVTIPQDYKPKPMTEQETEDRKSSIAVAIFLGVLLLLGVAAVALYLTTQSKPAASAVDETPVFLLVFEWQIKPHGAVVRWETMVKTKTLDLIASKKAIYAADTNIIPGTLIVLNIDKLP